MLRLPPFDYHRPSSVSEVSAILADQGPAARVVEFKTPNLGGGGGAIDPLTGGLAAVLTALGAIRLTVGRKKKRNNHHQRNR